MIVKNLSSHLPPDAEFVMRSPPGYKWYLYYSEKKKMYYKISPVRGGYDVKQGKTLQSCCGG